AEYDAGYQEQQDNLGWRILAQVQGALDKGVETGISQQKLSADEKQRNLNAALNSELSLINQLYERAYKGDMKAQEALNNFTFDPYILENASVEKFSALRDNLDKARLSVANSGMIGAMNRVKLGLKNMVENLVGENDPDAAALASVIAKAVNQSGQGAVQPEVLEEIQNRVKVFKLNNPASKAVDLGIVDNFRNDLESASKAALTEKTYGDRNLTPRDASAVIGNLTKLIESDQAMDPMEKTLYKSVIQDLLVRSGLAGNEIGLGMPRGNSSSAGTQTEPGTSPALDMLQKALDRLK
ncbi:MAG: hypothetical protein EBQ92_13420, partial [Proteobacteria bacterium]|nr:hypothetical protein [Pseudomonadota bacterium]